MKNIIMLVFCFFSMTCLIGQTNSAEATKATHELAKVYELTSKQQNEMLIIQMRKQKNLAEIASLETSDPELYSRKVAAQYEGTQASIVKLLTPAQKEIYRKRQAERRKKVAVKTKELRAQGKSKSEIRKAAAEIE